MFSFAKLTTFSLFAIVLATYSVKAHGHPRNDINIDGIAYEFAYDAESDIKANPNEHLRLIKFDADQSKYNITADFTSKHFRSKGRCAYEGNPKDKSTIKYSGPCTTSTKTLRQYFTVVCQDDPKMSNVTFSLFPTDGNDKNPNGNFAEAITYGKAKATFIENGKEGTLSQSASIDKPLASQTPDAGIKISCTDALTE